MKNNLFIGNISYQASENDLFDLFLKYGKVEDAKIILDRESGRSRGFGFVTMATEEDAEAAIAALDGQDLCGRPMAVKIAVSKSSPRRHDANA